MTQCQAARRNQGWIIISALWILLLLLLLWDASLQKSVLTTIRFVSDDPRAKRCALLGSDREPKNHSGSKRLTALHSTEYFLSINGNAGEMCRAFREELFPTEVPVSDAEREFPLAFHLAVYKSINQVARLLRLIYRPHNFYVIHVDRKSEQKFHEAVQEVSKCFGDNVLVVPRNESIEVVWGQYTVLEIELLAARLLLQMGRWKYLINLTGQELPLKTNLELVLALQMANGSNLVEATFKGRFTHLIPEANLSFPVTWLKNSLHAALRREFAEFMLTDKKAIELSEVLRKFAYTKVPDEQFYGTLAYNPHLGAPGACLKLHEPQDQGVKPIRLPGLVRYKLWQPRPCPTKYVRWICILGSQSLPDLIRAPHLFANKFHEDYFPEGYDCLEYEIAKRTYEGTANHFYPSLFANLYCSSEHI
ncbi:beta-1,3-galactosyl-O-glycosyl-glycoprotein beta-1,6-N-acetylglucosaminyltransferase activity [Sparganum proliferum]